MSKTKKMALIGGGSVAVVVVALAAAFWWLMLRDDAPEKASLAGAVSTLSTATPSNSASPPAASTSAAPTGTPVPSATSAAATPSSTTAAASTGINGNWTVDSTQKSFLGYRVKEQLVNIGANTAVGRTSKVTGKAVIAGDGLTSATVTGDLTALASDNNLRDGQLRDQAIETRKFPNSTFTLTSKVDLPAALATGTAVDLTLSGTLELHGVKKDVQVPVQAQLVNGLIVVVGSIDLKFSDYNVSSPRGASVLSIEDHGVMELQLFLKLG
jgi:polyisoprenoid-binding protein YceI